MIGQQLSEGMEETLGNRYFTCTSTACRSFGTAQRCLLLHVLSEWPVILRWQDQWGIMPMTCNTKCYSCLRTRWVRVPQPGWEWYSCCLGHMVHWEQKCLCGVCEWSWRSQYRYLGTSLSEQNVGVPWSQGELKQAGLVPNMTCFCAYFLKVPQLLPEMEVLFCCNSLPEQLHSENNNDLGSLEFSAWVDSRLPRAVTGQAVLLPWCQSGSCHVLSPHSSSLCTPVDFVKIRESAQVLKSFGSRWVWEVFFSALQDMRVLSSCH